MGHGLRVLAPKNKDRLDRSRSPRAIKTALDKAVNFVFRRSQCPRISKALRGDRSFNHRKSMIDSFGFVKSSFFQGRMRATHW